MPEKTENNRRAWMTESGIQETCEKDWSISIWKFSSETCYNYYDGYEWRVEHMKFVYTIKHLQNYLQIRIN